jgi:hypothetical protein
MLHSSYVDVKHKIADFLMLTANAMTFGGLELIMALIRRSIRVLVTQFSLGQGDWTTQ